MLTIFAGSAEVGRYLFFYFCKWIRFNNDSNAEVDLVLKVLNKKTIRLRMV